MTVKWHQRLKYALVRRWKIAQGFARFYWGKAQQALALSARARRWIRRGALVLAASGLFGWVFWTQATPQALPAPGSLSPATGFADQLRAAVADRYRLTIALPAAADRQMPSGTGGRSPIDAAAVPGPPEPVAVPARPVPTPAELPWPVRGQVVAEPGWRRHPSFGNWRFEPWIRLTAAPGEPVRAVLPGTVTEAGRDPEGGVRIIVDHGSGLVTVYGNLGHGLVVPGQRVSGSAAVGLAAHDVGATVYFAVYQDGEAVDPRALLAPQ